ncbi:3-oxoacyl-(acyl-carrier-protein) reductase [Pandoraea terrae]|uniref:3-oxoacyl-(Acyl-carrier-protein) reductase n=1 Tax=Pandoraea terrae TaxID=1537710 RepID=A0A5E4YJW0_9BURK|nr:SDR family NAD(P)-dependent oxidoreductase [Pandoraea terrae]VVE49146.1 3-oxoacyl-(acyl-carrier-protein) reductase [Pandoraea terrae]
MRLAGKVALVTGAGQGMGRAIARLFAQEGAAVVALDLNLAAAEETLAGTPGDGSFARSVNVADSAAVKAVFAEAVAKLGRVDVVVNNAGIGSVDALADTPDENWARVIGVNLTGTFYCLREAVRTMQALGTKGNIVNLASTAALNGEGPSHYCASKAGVMGLTRSAARELAATGIRVNTVVPGPTNTPMMQGIPDEWNDAIVKAVPMGRMGEPDEVARVALFLASDDASFITGQNIAVNGGMAFI